MDYNPNPKEILSNFDAIVLITSHINHNTAKLAKNISKVLYHNGSISSLKRTIKDCENCVCKTQYIYSNSINNID